MTHKTQPSAAPGNVTLLAFAAGRCAPCAVAAGCPPAAVDRYLLPAGPPAANPPHAATAVDG